MVTVSLSLHFICIINIFLKDKGINYPIKKNLKNNNVTVVGSSYYNLAWFSTIVTHPVIL